jgi:DNA repair protein RecO (recombination protein O)
MPNYQTLGIVIGRTNFAEADRIIRLITPDHGKVSAVAKGVRRIKSKSAGHLELFGEVNLVLNTGRNLDLITSARLQWYPHNVAQTYERLGLAFLMAKAVDRLTEPGHAQPKLYALLKEGLETADTAAPGPLPELWFKLRLLEVLGYRPELAGCLVCNRHLENLSYFFDAERGGIVCQDDVAAPGTIAMSTRAIKLWRLSLDYPFVQVNQIADATELAASTLAACDGFYEFHLGRTFRPTGSA